MVRVNKLSELIFIKMLFNYHVVRLGPIFKLMVKPLQLCFSSIKLAAKILYCLVRGLRCKFSLTQSQIGLKVRNLHKQLLVL